MFVFVFIDDILFYCRSENKYVDHLRIVLHISKFRNCEFLLMSISFLGHIVSSKGIEVDPKKTPAVKSYPRPLTPSNIRSVLGLVGYDRRFVEGVSSIASSLTAWTKNKSKFVWLESCEKSFQELKYRFNSATMLTLLKGNDGFVVYCDSSRVELGCFLMKKCKVIIYYLRQFKFHEKNYLTHDLEFVPIVFTLKIWRHYLYGDHVDIFNDDKSIQYVFI